MVQTIKFDGQCDIGVVTPNLSIKLTADLNNLVIKDTGTLSHDNGIDNVSGILGRVGDAFDAYNAQKFYANSSESK